MEPIKVKDINRILEETNQDGMVFTKLKEYNDKNYKIYVVLKISQNPTGLEFQIERKNTTNLMISSLKNQIGKYKNEDLVTFMIIEPNFSIQRGADFDGVFLDEKGNLIFKGHITPRMV